MEALLKNILEDSRRFIKEGAVANYIPELAKANADNFGVCVLSNDNQRYCLGDYNVPFTIQSIIKPIILLMALTDTDIARVRALVGVEATGKPFDAFNYSDQALTGEHINPMINTGAIALCTLIRGRSYEEKFSRLLEMTKIITDNPTLEIDEKVYLSEKNTGNKNRALAYMLKAYNMIDADVEEVVDFYFRVCSIKVNCVDLANIAFLLANHGENQKTGERIFSAQYAKYVNAVLMTCGMYDGSGEFALKVGIPAKSGVGGGIMAVAPNRMGIGVYSPALDKKGNSVAGIKALEGLSKTLDLSIF
ncbi:MAG: glutaminase A [Clostridia bacterium]|nr:glutaminase A [Clostridia bacterium]